MSVDPATSIQTVVAAAAEADGLSPLDEEALLSLKHNGVGDDFFAGDDRGFAWVHGSELHLVVEPAHRGRGIGEQLIESVPPGPLTAWSHGDHPAARSLAASHGWEATRNLLMLGRPGAPGAKPLREDTDGPITIRTFRPEDTEELLAVNAAAFPGHPEQGDLDEAGFAARLAEPWFDAAGLFVAERDGQLLGFHWTKVHTEGPDTGRGEVYVMAVLPSSQGLGLGRRLLEVGLDHLHPREVILYVESDNETAVALYSSIGFKQLRRDIQYSRSTN